MDEEEKSELLRRISERVAQDISDTFAIFPPLPPENVVIDPSEKVRGWYRLGIFLYWFYGIKTLQIE